MWQMYNVLLSTAKLYSFSTAGLGGGGIVWNYLSLKMMGAPYGTSAMIPFHGMEI